MSSARYDLIVVGSGPAGEKGAAQAAYFKKKVALVEKEPVLGGAAANTGTLPSKTLRETALHLSGYRQRDLYGVNLSLKERARVADLMFRERVVTKRERARVKANLERHAVDLYQGAASFLDPHTVQVASAVSQPTRIQGDVILVATGSSPRHPSMYPFEDPRIYDSDSILDLSEVPRSMLVVGGGVIGCEYACMFSVLGVTVELVEGRDRLLRFLDPEVVALLQRRMQAIGVKLHMPDKVKSLEPGLENIQAHLESGVEIEVETILIAAGRTGNTGALGLEEVGVELDSRGQIVVDATYKTSVPHIYAAGDVIGFPALASTSMEQARVAMVQAFDLKYKTALASVLPYGIYTIPECSMAGATESTLKEQGVPYVVGKATYGSNPRGVIIGEDEGFVKLLFSEEDMKLLGVHVIGEQATEIIHVGLTALMLEADVDLFIQTCYNYPTLTDLYKYAAYDALGRRAHRSEE